jgi:hypothetical protein
MANSRNSALEFSTDGSVIIDSSAGAQGNFGAIQFLKDSTISVLEGNLITGIDKLKTPLGAGTVLYGQFTSVSVSGGLVALHKF